MNGWSKKRVEMIKTWRDDDAPARLRDKASNGQPTAQKKEKFWPANELEFQFQPQKWIHDIKIKIPYKGHQRVYRCNNKIAPFDEKKNDLVWETRKMKDKIWKERKDECSWLKNP